MHTLRQPCTHYVKQAIPMLYISMHWPLCGLLDSNYSNHSSNGGKEVGRSCRLLVKFLCPDYGFTF